MPNLKKSFLMGTAAAGAALLASSIFFILAVNAACTNPSTTPTGFAAPCPVFSLSSTSVSQSQTLTLSATPQAGTDYIYTTAYVSEGTTWNPHTLAGNNAYPSYSSALASLTLSSTQLSTLSLGTHYAVVWDWLWDATANCYKGPGLNQCNTGQWRVQSFSLTSTYTYSQSSYYAYSQSAYTSGPVVSISPTTLAFPSQTVGTTSAVEYDTLTNTGNATLNFISDAITGDFAFGGLGSCGTPLAVGSSCTYSAKFTPTAIGIRTGTITINTNASNTPTLIPLSGTGVSSYSYSQASYYAYSQGTYYVYSQSSYYAYSQSTYTSYTYSQSAYYAYSQSAYTSGANIYFAQVAAGSNNGTSCGNAYAYNDGTHGINVAGNWIAGNTLHVCGTWTGGNGQQWIVSAGSGAWGNPVTVKFESSAVLRAPYHSSQGAIRINHQYITVDGGTNGLMQNTANGTPGYSGCLNGSCNVQQDSRMVYLTAGNVEIKNLHMQHIYVSKVGSGDSFPTDDGQYGVFFLGKL